VVTGAAIFLMPPMRKHLETPAHGGSVVLGLLRNPTVLASLTMVGFVMMSNFAAIPNFSAYFQYNVGVPPQKVGLLCLVGGAVSFVVMRIAGAVVDRFGAARVAVFGTASFVTIVFSAICVPRPLMPVIVFFVGFMATQSFRNVPMSSVSTRV